MRISFFNTYLQGGAASAAIALYRSLQQKSLNTVFYYSRNTEDITGFCPTETFAQRDYRLENKTQVQKFTDSLKARLHYGRLQKYERGRPEGFEQFSFPKQFFRTPYASFGDLPDIIHLHWIAEWLDYPSFFYSIPDDLPIVWTLHDMNAFTGGCHYSWDCKQYLTKCQFCPQLGPYKQGELVNESWKVKWEAISKKNMHIVADSSWIEEEVKKSGLLGNAKSFQTIHYGVDTSIFKPLKREIKNDSFKIGFGAASFDNKRKGFEVLLDALRLLYKRHQNIECIAFGKGQFNNKEDLPPVTLLGVIQDQKKLCEIYNEVDVFVIPSLQEAFGQTSLEAMACGTPVIGFETGGIPDTVIDGHTGLLARPGDALDISNKIEYLINNKNQRIIISRNAIEFIERNFSLTEKANKYMDLYNTVNARSFAKT